MMRDPDARLAVSAFVLGLASAILAARWISAPRGYGDRRGGGRRGR